MTSPEPKAAKPSRYKGKARRPPKVFQIDENGEKRKVYRTLADCTEKQRVFMKHYGDGETVYTAAKRAAYSGVADAYELMKNESFAALAQAQRQKNADAVQMTRERVMNGLIEAAEMAKLMAEPASMVSAWREIGKMSGYYAPIETKIRVEGNITLDKMNRLTDAELLEIVKPVTERLSHLTHGAEVQDVEPNDVSGDEPDD